MLEASLVVAVIDPHNKSLQTQDWVTPMAAQLRLGLTMFPVANTFIFHLKVLCHCL